MSSRRRLYLNLKKSITDLFKTPAHYLKEITGKQSIFEKPYYDMDYRQMHLDLPTPDWPVWSDFPPGFGPSPWPPPRKHTFVFDDGMCSFFGQTGECGETIFLSGWLSLIPPGSSERSFEWRIRAILNSALVEIEEPRLSLDGISVSVPIKLSDTASGTVVICAEAFSTKGSFLKEIAYEVPLHLGGVPTVPGWTPTLKYAMANLTTLYEARRGLRWDCGCVDLEITCCDDSEIAWSASNPTNINQSQSLPVMIVDPLKLGKPYSWSVSGTGFSLDYASTTVLNNMLNADASSCGTATITVVGCDGKVIKGYVRGAVGSWSGWTDGCKLSGTPDSAVSAYGVLTLIKTWGQYNQEQQIMQRAYSITSCDDEDCTLGCDYGACLDGFGCEDCLLWDCADFDTSGQRPTCPPWCCGGSASPIGTCDVAGRCMCNTRLRWREWEC